MKSPNAVKITLTKVGNEATLGGEFYKVTRICRAIKTSVSIPDRERITVGDTLNAKEADLLCDCRKFEVTIQ